ncbi:Sensory box histidine kinase/response regulator [hydrothermal vent metagenome]|uniref:Sensory box histidine kinase/response regulator n=1 Tax=hydrothermal vent metagenome TaxID=652676 RepID=A0A1W1D2N1_9ZZZZ
MDTNMLIIAGVGVIVVLGVIFFLIKSKKKEETPQETQTQEQSQQEKDEEKARILEEAKQARLQEAKEARLQKEQAEATSEETAPQQEEDKEEATPSFSLTSTREAREVPPHDKISKEDFAIFKGMRVLVAEDNMINQKVIKGLLGDSGIELVMANDGAIALDILSKDSDFSIVLMDAHMPNIDGFEASRQIRSNPNYNHIVVVALSGDTAADDIKKMVEAGMQEQLEKPLKMDALYDVLYKYADTIGEAQSNEAQEETTTQKEDTSNKLLNTEKGLTTCGGDKEFYVELLNEFASSFEDSRVKLDRFFNNNDFTGADKLLHEIGGVAGNIGAEPLQAHILKMREAIKENNIQACIDMADEYENMLMQTIDEIVDFQ